VLELGDHRSCLPLCHVVGRRFPEPHGKFEAIEESERFLFRIRGGTSNLNRFIQYGLGGAECASLCERRTEYG